MTEVRDYPEYNEIIRRLVNIHARQYDAATAATDSGIAYSDCSDVSVQKTKLTVEETYRRILEDCSDEVIALLPSDDGGNVLRGVRAFGNAVRAKVLMQMKRYDGALPYALEALRLNGKIEDHHDQRSVGGTQGNEYGINSDRMYYTAAECYLRTGEICKGLELVDRVRSYRVEGYEPYATLYDAQPFGEVEAMSLLQCAKWIESVGSYENFFDCKRWNTEPAYRRTITRDLGEEYGTFFLPPDSPLWILPFPASATRYNPSLTQNF